MDKVKAKFMEWVEKIEYPKLKRLLKDNIDNERFYNRNPELGSNEYEKLAIQ